jgi:catechol 2,3-dioxygenase-like lactoylglutathione lyase family enzyme
MIQSIVVDGSGGRPAMRFPGRFGRTDMSERSAVGFVMLASADPDRLRRWYRDVLGVDPDGSSGLLVDGRDDLAPANPEPHRFIVNVLVEDAAAVEARLVAGGVVWVRELERGACGSIGTVVDPDGNYVQFIEQEGESRRRWGSPRPAPPGRRDDGDRGTRGEGAGSRRAGERSAGAGRERRRRPRPGR